MRVAGREELLAQDGQAHGSRRGGLRLLLRTRTEDGKARLEGRDTGRLDQLQLCHVGRFELIRLVLLLTLLSHCRISDGLRALEPRPRAFELLDGLLFLARANVVEDRDDDEDGEAGGGFTTRCWDGQSVDLLDMRKLLVIDVILLCRRRRHCPPDPQRL